MNWGWSQPQGKTRSLHRTAVALGWVSSQGRVQSSQRSLESVLQPALDHLGPSVPHEGMQYRKPGLSLSNWLHLFPSWNSGAGPEGMNGKEGPVHHKEATWGDPS